MTLRQRIGLGALLVGGVVGLAGGWQALALGDGRSADDLTSSRAPRLLPVRVARVEGTTGYERVRSYTGVVAAHRASELGFERGGEVVGISVDDGDEVARGAELARLDRRALDHRREALLAKRARLAAELDLLRAGPRQDELDAARERVRALERDLALARVRVERAEALLARRALAPDARDEAAYQAEALAARLAAARHDLSELEAGARAESVRAQEAALAELAASIAELEVERERSILRAPFAGRIAARRVDEGAVVGAGQPVLRILESGALEARFGLAPDIAARLSPGDAARLSIRGRPATGHVRTVLPEVDPATRTQAVIVDLGPGARAAAGDVARLEIAERVEAQGVWLPLDALAQGTEGLFTAYGVEPTRGLASRVVRHELEVLHTEPERALVRGTIAPGALVVSAGAHRVVPGQLVRAIETAPLAEAEVAARVR